MGDIGERLKAGVVAALVLSRSHMWMLRRQRRRVTILMYHGFYEKARRDGLEHYGSRWCELDDFKGHLAYLQRHAHVVSLEQLVQHYHTGSPLPDNAVVITMDDGYASNYRLAYPLLAERNMPASIFVSTRFVARREFLWPDRIEYAIWKTDRDRLEVLIAGQPQRFHLKKEQDKRKAVDAIKQRLKGLSHRERMALIDTLEDMTGQALSEQRETPPLFEPLSWEEIRTLASGGLVSIGSHSVRHPNLTTCTDEQLREELVESKASIARETGKACAHFCFPGGAYDARVKRFVSDAGYDCALAIGGAFERREETDMFELKRIGVARSMHVYGFIGRLLR